MDSTVHEEDVDSDQVMHLNGEPFTGVAYEDEPTRSEVAFVDGLQDGPARDWFAGGGLRSEAWFRRGVGHGIQREYDEHGRLIAEQTDECGVTTHRASYSSDGDLIEEWTLDVDSFSYRYLQRCRETLGWPTPQDTAAPKVPQQRSSNS
jgi:hypothetical protein